MIHVRWVAHTLGLVAESVRHQYPLVNELIYYWKKIFQKAGSRQDTWREANPDIKLTPDPVVTRWCTWLNAAEYYANYLEQFAKVVNDMDEKEAF